MRALILAVAIAVMLPSALPRAARQDPQQPPPSEDQDNQPKPQLMDTPGVKLLKGLTVPEFDDEMKGFVEALGVANCGYCHERNDFPSDDNPNKVTARRMIEMTLMINKQFYPDFTPGYGQSHLGKVTCFTCHQGAETPRTSTIGDLMRW